MLIIFLRAVVLFLFILVVLRLTGKRQISDLQPFDLLITLAIADIASCAIADSNIPLLFSIVPILALYLVQQAIAKLCLKSAAIRRLFCGSPLMLIRDGVLQEGLMRDANYTVSDIADSLRSHGYFDIGDVSYAILETNGSLSVLPRSECAPASMRDLNIETVKAEPSYMLMLDGKLCHDTLKALGLDDKFVEDKLKAASVKRLRDVFYMQLSPNGELRMQLRGTLGGRIVVGKK